MSTIEEKFIIAHLHGGAVDGQFYGCVLREMNDPACAGVIPRENGVNLCLGRNLLAQEFLAQTDAQWMLLLDSDICWTQDVRLFAALRPIASETTISVAPYFSFNRGSREVKPTIFDWDLNPMTEITAEPFPVYAAGTGCMLIHRKILEKVWFVQHEDGRYLEDIGFCLEVQKAGFRIMCDARIRLGHTKQITIWPEDYIAYRGPQDEKILEKEIV